MRMAGDLLLAREIEAGELVLGLADVDMAELAREAAEMISGPASSKKIDLTANAGDPAVVRGDRTRLLQLLDNLLGNAVKFTPAGGQVGLSVAAEGGSCRIEVSDTGIGIPPEGPLWRS